jgi:hypothetical protein
MVMRTALFISVLLVAAAAGVQAFAPAAAAALPSVTSASRIYAAVPRYSESSNASEARAGPNAHSDQDQRFQVVAGKLQQDLHQSNAIIPIGSLNHDGISTGRSDACGTL